MSTRKVIFLWRDGTWRHDAITTNTGLPDAVPNTWETFRLPSSHNQVVMKLVLVGTIGGTLVYAEGDIPL